MARPCTEAQTAKAQSISLLPDDRPRARQGLSYFLRRILLEPERGVARSFPLFAPLSVFQTSNSDEFGTRECFGCGQTSDEPTHSTVFASLEGLSSVVTNLPIRLHHCALRQLLRLWRNITSMLKTQVYADPNDSRCRLPGDTGRGIERSVPRVIASNERQRRSSSH